MFPDRIERQSLNGIAQCGVHGRTAVSAVSAVSKTGDRPDVCQRRIDLPDPRNIGNKDVPGCVHRYVLRKIEKCGCGSGIASGPNDGPA